LLNFTNFVAVEKGDLKIPADKDPRVQQAKSDKLMEELLQSHKGLLFYVL